MLWIVPFNAVTLPIPAPVDPTLDRFALAAVVGVWATTWLVARSSVVAPHRPTGIDVCLVGLLVIAVFSVLLNMERLIAIDELELAVKKVFLLFTFPALFLLVTTVVRASELRSWCVFVTVLAVLVAIGVIYEYRTGTNVFYNWTDKLLPGSFSVGEPPEDPRYGRENVVGPTDSAIAAGTMLAMGLAFALTGLMQAGDAVRKGLYAVAATLILAASFGTLRKTGLVAPVAALIVLFAYRPRQMIRLLPLGLVMLVAIQFLAPGAISRVKAQFLGGGGFTEQKSVEGRTDDYGPLKPDIVKNLPIGRGHGTYDPDRYRFVDNEYLGRIIETGVIGLVVYLLLILAVIRVAYRASRSRDPVRARVGIAAVAGAAVYGVTNAVFDALSFPQAPYLFFLIAGLAVVAASPAEEGERP